MLQRQRDVIDGDKLRFFEPALLDLERAAQLLRGQQYRCVGRHRIELPLRTAGQQLARIGLARIRKQFRSRRDLYQAALFHHADPVCKMPYQIQVVRDEQHRHVFFALQLIQQLQNLYLDRHVQRSSRLVGNQQFRFAGQRHRDHRALALAAGELMRVRQGPSR